jgi:hypothetical protein
MANAGNGDEGVQSDGPTHGLSFLKLRACDKKRSEHSLNQAFWKAINHGSSMNIFNMETGHGFVQPFWWQEI